MHNLYTLNAKSEVVSLVRAHVHMAGLHEKRPPEQRGAGSGSTADDKDRQTDRQSVASRVTVRESTMRLEDAHEMLRTKVDAAKAWFATHIGLDNLDAFKHTHSKLEPWYQLDSEYDLQQSFCCKLEGINEPQMFFKGDGAWTGLHVEDCGLASFNINFGPGTSLWTLIHEDECPKLLSAFRKELKTTKELNIRNIGLLYYFSTNFLQRHGIEYECVLQRSGDAIYVPGYTMHQVQNLRSGANIAWNLLLLTSERRRYGACTARSVPRIFWLQRATNGKHAATDA